MSFDKCRICGDYDFLVTHTCKPIFYITDPDWSDEEIPERGIDHQEAAERYAERQDRDSADYQVVGGQELFITVRAAEETEGKKFKVTGEMRAEYSAEEVTP